MTATVFGNRPLIFTASDGRVSVAQSADVDIILPTIPSTFAVLGSNVSVPNGTWVTVLSATITLTAARYVCAWANMSWTGGNASVIGTRLIIDGTTGGTRTARASGNGQENAIAIALRSNAALAAGTYTVSVEANVQADGAITVSEATLLAMQA